MALDMDMGLSHVLLAQPVGCTQTCGRWDDCMKGCPGSLSSRYPEEMDWDKPHATRYNPISSVNPFPGSKSHQHERGSLTGWVWASVSPISIVASVAQVTGKGKHMYRVGRRSVPHKDVIISVGAVELLFSAWDPRAARPRLACSNALPGSFKPPAIQSFPLCLLPPRPSIRDVVSDPYLQGPCRRFSPSFLFSILPQRCLGRYDRTSARVPQTKIWRPN